ncbi:MAG: leucine-rich repeat domain-containing protein [Ruminococcus sp.]|nr:leucine-rich repeat domain-containing protein [Ruminococcus sp.]
MQCEICYSELNENALSCSNCGAPVPHAIEGFDNSLKIQSLLYNLVIENFSTKPIVVRNLKALLMDYLADYRAECRLLIYTINAGVLQNMFVEEDRNIAIMRARSFLINECFISDKAVEFVLACLTYMLKWEFTPLKGDNKPVAVQTADPVQENQPKIHKTVNIDSLVLRPIDALKYKLMKNIVINKEYTKIEAFAFDKFTSMKSIKLPLTLVAIEEYAFSGCKHLRSVELPPSLRIIRHGAFDQCSELESIKIPHGVLEIEDNTFLGCLSLSMADIPPTVTSIGVQAFSNCEKLSLVYIPDSVKFIDENAFVFCPNLTVKCYENSYAHKYCLTHNINCKTVSMGMDLYNSLIF